MSRIARVALENVPYHVTQRGNSRQTGFSSRSDFRIYLDLLHTYAEKYRLRVRAYCLMPNHVHLVAVPAQPQSMAKALGRTHADYARHFNLTRGRTGHVWEARYYSCPLDDAHLVAAMAYVERNPVRAGLAEHAGRYPWSSAAAHLGQQVPDAVLDPAGWPAQYSVECWREALSSSLGEEALSARLREATARGRPCGDLQFVAELERRARRLLRPRPPGRPRKAAAAEAQLLLEC